MHETREALPPTLFFFIGFNFIVLTTNLLVAQYLVAVSNFMLATMAALVVGKAVLVANKMPVATENRIRAGADAAMGYPRFGMIDLWKLLGGLLVGLFRSRAAREAEMAFLRQQLVVLQRSAPARLRLRTADRLIFVWLYRLFPSLLEAAVVFKPETLVRWHRSGFRLYWRCKSRRRVGRPAVPADIRDLIRTISRDNPLWGAPRIHGELLKLGIDIAQSTVAKYMARRRGPRSPGWQAFLRNHTAHIAGVDLFVVPTIGFKLLYGLVILRLERRRLVWTDVTANPTAEWIARQITEAFPWDEAPRYLIRDRDTSYGAAVTRRLQARAFATGRSRHAHRGRTVMLNG